MLRMGSRLAICLCLSAVAMPALATETVTYTYDAKGRLVKVVRSGSVNNGVATTYDHDKADNRTKVKVAGAAQ